MTRDDITRMAAEAGITPWVHHQWVGGNKFVHADEGMDGDLACLMQFAALVAAAALAEPLQEKILKQQAQVNRDVLTTHSDDCYQWHHECAIAEVERLRAFAAHPEQAEKVAYAAGWYQSMCAHCTDPRYAGVRCGVCGRSS